MEIMQQSASAYFFLFALTSDCLTDDHVIHGCGQENRGFIYASKYITDDEFFYDDITELWDDCMMCVASISSSPPAEIGIMNYAGSNPARTVVYMLNDWFFNANFNDKNDLGKILDQDEVLTYCPVHDSQPAWLT